MLLGFNLKPAEILHNVLDKTLEFIKAVSGTVLDMNNSFYHDKPLIFTGAMFREKLVS